jgi:nucleolar protein 56
MKLIIGDYHEGRLEKGYYNRGDDIPSAILQELKGRFTEAYRDANIQLTEQQLLAAATPDQDAIQAVHALQGVDTVLNTLGKYTTEWYQLHHPAEDVTWPALTERHLSEQGLGELNTLVRNVNAEREKLITHIERTLATMLPSTLAIAGGVTTAKLLSASGGAARLATLPASTIQLLGAEQALFRFLKQQDSKPPKYGHLYGHPLVQSVPQRNRGKMARALANAIAIAIRVDHHHGEYVGDTLKRKLEVRRDALART